MPCLYDVLGSTLRMKLLSDDNFYRQRSRSQHRQKYLLIKLLRVRFPQLPDVCEV